GVPHPTLPRGVLHRLAMGMSPVSRALNAARLRLAKFQFIEISTQTLGHVRTQIALCLRERVHRFSEISFNFLIKK
ncbi:MAG: hypothetical protein IJN23_04250, partial [Akkermansia sp.]|nr:hypothetical protein [Akkermansia sp.]